MMFCLFALPLCVWDGLRLVIVALPGLFSYFLVKFNIKLRSNVVLFLTGSLILVTNYR